MSFTKPVLKQLAEEAIDNLSTHGEIEPPAFDQVKMAKQAVKLLLPIIPGPYIGITMSGHANGIGWQKKDGWANDCITVNITQFTEEPR